MTIVGYVVGVFDCFHSGHINMISKSAMMCDTLIVGIHSDAFAISYKRKPHHDEQTRKQCIVDHFQYSPDHVVIIDDKHIDLIHKFGITKIFHGDDWELESYKTQIKYDHYNMKALGVEIHLIPYTKGISTTEIIKDTLFDMSPYKSIYFDLDNTLVLNHKPLMHAIDCIEECKKRQYAVSIVTNNNRYSPSTLHAQLQTMGFNIDHSEIISSLHQVMDLCQKTYRNKRVAVWGTNDAITFLAQNGIKVVASDPNLIVLLYRNDFTYEELVRLMTMIGKGVPYVVGNTDKTYPDVLDTLPDTGAVANMIQFVTGVSPTSVLGKTTYLLDTPDNSSVLYIGDSPYTDKVFAHNNGFGFLQVGCDVSHLGVVVDYMKHRP